MGSYFSIDHYECEWNCGSTLCTAPEYIAGTSTSISEEELLTIKNDAIHDIKMQPYFLVINNSLDKNDK